MRPRLADRYISDRRGVHTQGHSNLNICRSIRRLQRRQHRYDDCSPAGHAGAWPLLSELGESAAYFVCGVLFPCVPPKIRQLTVRPGLVRVMACFHPRRGRADKGLQHQPVYELLLSASAYQELDAHVPIAGKWSHDARFAIRPWTLPTAHTSNAAYFVPSLPLNRAPLFHRADHCFLPATCTLILAMASSRVWRSAQNRASSSFPDLTAATNACTACSSVGVSLLGSWVMTWPCDACVRASRCFRAWRLPSDPCRCRNHARSAPQPPSASGTSPTPRVRCVPVTASPSTPSGQDGGVTSARSAPLARACKRSRQDSHAPP